LRLQAKSGASDTDITWRHCWSFADILQHSTALSGTHLGEECLLLAQITFLFLVWNHLHANQAEAMLLAANGVYVDMESRKQKSLAESQNKNA
jgi:hypothetical protein